VRVDNFAFGKAAPGKTNPSLFVAGRLQGAPDGDVYLSTDMGASFSAITPEGKPDFYDTGITGMAGAWNTFGTVYLGTDGTGVLCSVLTAK